MGLSRKVQSVVLATLFIIAGGQPKAISSDVPEIPRLMSATELKASKNGHFIVTADINGRRVRVLVDTGASAVALSFEDAQSIGLHPKNLNFTVPVSTANGVGKAASVLLDEVEIDGVRVSNVQGLVLQEGVMSGSLLGMSFLSKLRSFKIEDGVLYLKN